MASSRPKRNITAPKKFGDDEGYLLPGRETASTRKVYRLLEKRDLAKDLRKQTVYVLWPDDSKWYEAKIEKVTRKDLQAKLSYVGTDEEEEVDLDELVELKQIATMEYREVGVPLGPNEIPVDSDPLLQAATEQDIILPGVAALNPALATGGMKATSIVDDITKSVLGGRQPSASELMAGHAPPIQPSGSGVLNPLESTLEKLPNPLGETSTLALAPTQLTTQDSGALMRPLGVADDHALGLGDLMDLQVVGNEGGGVGVAQSSDLWNHSMLGVQDGSGKQGPDVGTSSGSVQQQANFEARMAAISRSAGLMDQPPGPVHSHMLNYPPHAVLMNSAYRSILQQQAQFQSLGVFPRREFLLAETPKPPLAARPLGHLPYDVQLGDCLQPSLTGRVADVLAPRSSVVEAGIGVGGVTLQSPIDTYQLQAPKRTRSPTSAEASASVSISLGLPAWKKPRGDASDVANPLGLFNPFQAGPLAMPGMPIGPMQVQQMAQMAQMSQMAQLNQMTQMVPVAPVAPQMDAEKEAADFSRNLLASIAEQKAQEDEKGKEGGGVVLPAPPAPPSNEVIREKTRGQLVGALEMAVKEINDQEEKKEEEEPLDPKEVAEQVEDELYRLCGSANREYKQKFRSLQFNLKDKKNLDLRAQVVLGKITPHALVRMSAQELASSEHKKWREQKTQEFLKQSVLDSETAAAFSAAAALEKKKEMRQRMEAIGENVSTKNASSDQTDQDEGRKESGEETSTEVDKSKDRDDKNEKRNAPATSLGSPKFDIAKALESAEAIELDDDDDDEPGGKSDEEMEDANEKDENNVEGGEDFKHIDVPPSPPLSPIKSSSDDEDRGAGEEDVEVVEKEEDAVYDPESPGMVEEGGEGSGELPQGDVVPDWAMLDGDEGNVEPVKDDEEKVVAEDTVKDEVMEDAMDVTADKGITYSPSGGGRKSGYSPTGWEEEVEDMSPLVLAPVSGVEMVGCKVWSGQLTASAGNAFSVVCEAVAGLGDLSIMMGSEMVEIKGRVGLDKVENFLRELRNSRNRTVTLGILKLPKDAGLADQTYLNELITHYSTKGRTGVITPGSGLEGYLVPKSTLAASLALTARNALPLEHKTFVPENIRSTGELMLVLIHRKDWQPPAGMRRPPVAAGQRETYGEPVTESQENTAPSQPQQPTEGYVANVMEWGGMSKEIAEDAGLGMSVPGNVQDQQQAAPVSDPRLKDPRLRAGIQDPRLKDQGAAQPVQSTSLPSGQQEGKGVLPPGLTAKAISDLAALFGISGQKGVPGGLSLPMTSQPQMGGLQDPRQASHRGASTSGVDVPGMNPVPQVPGQMAIPTAPMNLQGLPGQGGLPGQAPRQGFPMNQMNQFGFAQQTQMFQAPQKVDAASAGGQPNMQQVLQVPGAQGQSVVFVQDRPRFLAFDPTTGKAVPIDPSLVQYDPASNQIVLNGPLPAGAPGSGPGGFPVGGVSHGPGLGQQSSIDQERLLVNSQGIPIVVKKPKKGAGELGDGDRDEEEEAHGVQIMAHNAMGNVWGGVQGYGGEMEGQQANVMDPMHQSIHGMIPQMLQSALRDVPHAQNQEVLNIGANTGGYGGRGRGRGRGRGDGDRRRGRGRNRRDQSSNQGGRGGMKGQHRNRGTGNSESLDGK